jgi:formylmethanofuran:tetrahydromethanopterin formyltransferase
MSADTKTMTPQEAAALVAADRQRRAATAAQALQALLAEYGCELAAQPVLTADGRLSATIQIVAQPI